MTAIGPRGTYVMTRAALPYLERGANPHVLTLAPPIVLDSRWVGQPAACTFKKFAMTIVTLAFGAEFRHRGIAANALWPKTTINLSRYAVARGTPLTDDIFVD